MAAQRRQRIRKPAEPPVPVVDTSEDPPDAGWRVHQCLVWVAKHIGPIAKAKHSNEVAYKFRSIEQIMAAAHDLIIASGLCLTPWDAELLEVMPLPNKGKGGWTIARVKYTWKITGPGGDFDFAKTIGFGEDNSDKGSNKAQTQAWKYLLLPMLNIVDPADDGDRYNNNTGDNDWQPEQEPRDWFEVYWPDGGKTEHDEELAAVRSIITNKLDEAGRAALATALLLMNNGVKKPPFTPEVMFRYRAAADLLAEPGSTGDHAPAPAVPDDPFEQLKDAGQ